MSWLERPLMRVRQARTSNRRALTLAARAASVTSGAAVHVSLGWGNILASLWLASSGLFLASNIVRIVRVRGRLAAAPPAPAVVQELAEEMALRLGLRQCPRVWFVSRAIAPALWAVGRQPRLLIPAELWERLADDQRAALLVHELAHWKRRDHWVRLLELLATALCWWLPVLWWVRRSLHEAEEQGCDAWVIWALPGSEAPTPAPCWTRLTSWPRSDRPCHWPPAGLPQWRR